MSTADQTGNALLLPSKLPFSAFPFDALKREHFLPALDEALREARVNLDIIRDRKEPADFSNTVVALEVSAETLNRVGAIFFNLLGTNSDEELQRMAREVSPKLADFSSDVLLDSGLFARVKEVWTATGSNALKGEDRQLCEKLYRDFVRNGSLLDNKEKERLRAIDQELANLSPQFSDNVLKATNDFKMFLDLPEKLAGLPESAIEAAAAAAKAAGKDSGWLITLHGPSYIAFMTYSSDRGLREKLWRASASRAFRDANDNEGLAKKIAQLRHARAVQLGYKTHADFVLEERMAETPEKVTRFLTTLLGKVEAAAKRDVAAVRKSKEDNDSLGELMPWDYVYYAEKLKMRTYDLDQEQLRPYFKLENVVQGVFAHATRLYGLVFTERPDLPVSHPDVKAFEVRDEESGKHIGLLYTDFFPRESKRGGAWMSSFRDQGLQNGKIERPHVTIVCNFTQPTPTKPSLLTFTEVSTLFHEFGHSLHSLLSDCTYVSLGGTNVYWDFVELPSQIMENWALEKDALDLFAKHYQTGEKIPRELVDKLRASAKFQAGYQAIRQLQFALLDMAWHAHDPKDIADVSVFEKAVTEKISLLPIVEGTNSSCSFSHIFAGGYSAGYYSYKWAEVLDADAFELFKEKGIFNREVANKFRDTILARGGTQHPMELYKKFRGREPDPNALLRRDGLIDDASAKMR